MTIVASVSNTNPGIVKPPTVEDHAAGFGCLRPRQLTGPGTWGPDPVQPAGVDAIIQDPPRRGVRGHLAEQLSLVAQHRQSGDRLATVGSITARSTATRPGS